MIFTYWVAATVKKIIKGGIATLFVLCSVLMTPLYADTDIILQPLYLGISNASDFGRWPDAVVPYSYNPNNAPALFFDQQVTLGLIQEAMQAWENVSGVSFQPAGNGISNSDYTNSDDDQVVIAWSGSLSGAAGQGGAASSCTGTEFQALGYCAYRDGSVLMNNNQQIWGSTLDERARANFVRVMVHELGHLLGLGHSDNPASVMYSNPYNSLNFPRDDDIAAVQALYGPPAVLVPAVQYSPPSVVIDARIQDVYFSVDDGSGNVNLANNTTVTQVDSSTTGTYVWSMIQSSGIAMAVELVYVDPQGYYYDGTTVNLNCSANSICTNGVTVATLEAMGTIPGAWTVYLLINNRLAASKALSVNTSVSFNQAPTASFSASVSSGAAPLTVALNLTAVTDGEGDAVDVNWYIPTQGVLFNVDADNLTVLPGSSSRNVTFTQDGTYTIYVALDDGQSRYGVLNSGSESGSGFRTLLSKTITVSSVASVASTDVDGDSDVDADDGLMIQRRLTGASDVTPGVLLPAGEDNASIVARITNAGLAYDVDGDGEVDADDGLMIQRRLTGAGDVTPGVVLPVGVSNSSIVAVIDALQP
ncbi:MAG: matrixin family metalloprotease [Gammaproteobacteria bacterium]|nr:matrixin family metalloprotease [Gammaproteobacteria bacterium]